MTTSRQQLRASLQALEALAARAGAPVRYESFKVLRPKERETSSVARGGLVRLGPRALILCEQALPVIDKIAVLAEALASLGVEVLDLPPVLRARLRRRPARKARIVVSSEVDTPDRSRSEGPVPEPAA